MAISGNSPFTGQPFDYGWGSPQHYEEYSQWGSQQEGFGAPPPFDQPDRWVVEHGEDPYNWMEQVDWGGTPWEQGAGEFMPPPGGAPPGGESPGGPFTRIPAGGPGKGPGQPPQGGSPEIRQYVSQSAWQPSMASMLGHPTGFQPQQGSVALPWATGLSQQAPNVTPSNLPPMRM